MLKSAAVLLPPLVDFDQIEEGCSTESLGPVLSDEYIASALA
jgi:hypothetical protein